MPIVIDVGPLNVTSSNSSSERVGHFGAGNALILGILDLVAFGTLGLAGHRLNPCVAPCDRR